MPTALFQQLAGYIAQFPEEEAISPTRKQALKNLAKYIRSNARTPVRLNFICTHNSRRSHLAMVWAAVSAYLHGHDHVTTLSGGTEATALHPNMVGALRRAGFKIEVEEKTKAEKETEANHPGQQVQVPPLGGLGGTLKGGPRYLIHFAEGVTPLRCFSKVYDHPSNAAGPFAAVMVCDSANEACPVIPGAAARLPLTYADPKVGDGTAREEAIYDERVGEIGRDLLWGLG